MTETYDNPDGYRETLCHSCNQVKQCVRHDLEFMPSFVRRIGVYDNIPLSDFPDLCDDCLDKIVLEPFREHTVAENKEHREIYNTVLKNG